jgi:biopolymer transport protein ExbD
MSAHGQKETARESSMKQLGVGFQIAPMIDVVFVIMLFFMVMVGSVKVERELKTSFLDLPPPARMPRRKCRTRFIVGVEEDGTVTLNEEPFDGPADKKTAQFHRHAHAAQAGG